MWIHLYPDHLGRDLRVPGAPVRQERRPVVGTRIGSCRMDKRASAPIDGCTVVDFRQGANVDTVPSTLRLTIDGTTDSNSTIVNDCSVTLIPFSAANSSFNSQTSILTSRYTKNSRIKSRTSSTSRIKVTPRECLYSCPYSASAQVWNGGSASAFFWCES